jgi:hypothetical protein
MALSDVLKSKQFAALSDEQKVFVKALTENGWDFEAATRTAWKCGTEASFRSKLSTVKNNPRVLEILALIDPAKAPIDFEECLQLVAKVARTSSEAKDILDSVRLIAKLRGWEKDAPTADSTPKDIYEQVEEMGKQ